MVNSEYHLGLRRMLLCLALVVQGVHSQGIRVETLWSTASTKGWFTESVYSPIDQFGSAIYFVYLDTNRVPHIGKTLHGKTVTARLDQGSYGKAYDDGHHEFSLGVDERGYIHVAGDVHNFPHMEADNVPSVYKNAGILYWVSENPEDISRFTFAGTDTARSIPGEGHSYGSFRADRNGRLYFVSRTMAQSQYYQNGGRGLGISAYDAEGRKWKALGAPPPSATAKHSVVVWENSGMDGGSYQMYKGDMVFDRKNRLHLAVACNNDNPSNEANHVVYAYSDDGGATFRKADGSAITGFPMRVDQGPAQLDVLAGGAAADIGQAAVAIDAGNEPAVHYRRDGKGYYRHLNGKAWSQETASPIQADRGKLFLHEASGQVIFNSIASGKLDVADDYGQSAESFSVGRDLRYVSYRTLRDSAAIYGISWNTSSGEFRLLRITINRVNSSISPKPFRYGGPHWGLPHPAYDLAGRLIRRSAYLSYPGPIRGR